MARLFNGSSDKMSSSSAVVGSPPATMMAWAKRETVNTQQTILSISDSSDDNPLFRIGRSSATQAFVQYRGQGGGGSNNVTGSTAISTTQFDCIVGTFDDDANFTVEIFLNGSSEGTDSGPTGAITGADRTTIGVLERTSDLQFFDGECGECAIWNVVLTDAEIAELAKGKSPKRVRPESLVSYTSLVREVIDELGAASFTITGTTVVPHDIPIILPTARILQFPPAAAAAPFLPIFPKKTNVLLRM